jgi:hypothetical protein
MTTHSRGQLGASTKIALIDGHVTTIGDIAASWYKGVRRYTYSHDETGRGYVHWTSIESARRTMYNMPHVLRVTLDDSSTIDCTPTQAFLLENDAWVPAEKLAVGDVLRTVEDLHLWTWRSSPVDIPVAYAARRSVAAVQTLDEPVEVFEFALNKGDSVAHPSGIFLRS